MRDKFHTRHVLGTALGMEMGFYFRNKDKYSLHYCHPFICSKDTNS